MPHIELPRALEDYFAFAETTPTRNGRRFSVTLPYLDGERLDRLQWWYHISPAQEQMYEGGGLAFFRARAVERFCGISNGGLSSPLSVFTATSRFLALVHGRAPLHPPSLR